MLATGLVAAVALWRFLMLAPPPAARTVPGEQLSWHDRRALERVLERAGESR
ncbi:MAG TPA: hypothetical protein VKW76_02890 [Candidatus Binatia bacterium]|nr:hypothetical protein [Candidatus Binatia bacterium]